MELQFEAQLFNWKDYNNDIIVRNSSPYGKDRDAARQRERYENKKLRKRRETAAIIKDKIKGFL